MHAFLMLCDFAETINGKLYVQGGGWTQIASGGGPVNYFLAGKIFVPWTHANRESNLRLALYTEDGEPAIGPDGEPVQVDGAFEVGRPPGIKQGTELDLPLSFKLEGLALPPARYRWSLTVDGTELASVTYQVHA